MRFPGSKLVQSDERYKVWQYRGLRVVLDRKRVIPKDPGADTPAMVHFACARYRACATYWCAIGESELMVEWSGAVHKLTENQCEWLASLDEELTEFLYGEPLAVPKAT